MARRGALTALQAVLAGVSGGAQGYVQQQELERKRQQERAAQEERDAERARMLRGEARDIVRLGGKPVAQAGQEVAGPIPSAVPLTAPGLSALDAAMAAGGPSTSRGAFRQELPGIGTFMLPSAEEQQAIGDQRAIDLAIRQAQATQDVKRSEEDRFNRQNYETYRDIYGKGGAYNPNLNYAKAIEAAEAARGRASAEGIARMRTSVPSGGAGGAAGRPDERGPLPSVLSTIERLNKMTDEDVLSLRPSRIAMASEAPLMMSEAGGAMKLPALGAASLMNWSADPEEQAYANMIAAVGDAVARAAERGVLTNQDIARYRGQVQPLGGDDEQTQIRKFQTLKAWAQWLSSENPMMRLPGETIDEFNRRTSMLRQR